MITIKTMGSRDPDTGEVRLGVVVEGDAARHLAYGWDDLSDGPYLACRIAGDHLVIERDARGPLCGRWNGDARRVIFEVNPDALGLPENVSWSERAAQCFVAASGQPAIKAALPLSMAWGGANVVRMREAPTRGRGDGEQLSVLVPSYVRRQVEQLAHDKGMTLRQAVLHLFANAGIDVPASEVVDRRREAGRISAELYRRHKAGEFPDALREKLRETIMQELADQAQELKLGY